MKIEFPPSTVKWGKVTEWGIIDAATGELIFHHIEGSMKIWKWELNFDVRNHLAIVHIPRGGKILSLQVQQGKEVLADTICLWAEVNPALPIQERVFELFGTGHDIPEDFQVHRNYIATVQVGEFVWHIYERVTFKRVRDDE
jgi:hypothetical protein